MAAATKCGYCWARLAPVQPGSPGTRHGAPSPVHEYPPADELLRRDCPRCGRRIMLAATTCGFCWLKMPPAVAPLAVTGPLLVAIPETAGSE